MDVIIHTIQDSGGVRVLELRAADGAALPAYEAGAHVDVTLGNGVVRQYSLCCSEPSEYAYRLGVKREPQSRGGSAWLHDVAQVGTVLKLGQPRNAFALAPSAGQYLLYAGGIGITPILSMAYALLRRGAAFRVAYFVRDAASIAFASELTAGPLAPHVDIYAGLSVDAVGAGLAASMAAAPAAGTQVYVCGPGPFMDAVMARGASRFGADAVHQESFSAVATGGEGEGETAFVLKLARSRREIAVPVGRSALACLQDAGIDIDCSCEVGVCGTCRTALLDGVPDHRDSFLSAQERQANDCFMPCVSRARGVALVLDL